MTEICYRPFRSCDVDRIVSGWNDSIRFDPVDQQWFFEYVLLDQNFDPAGLTVAETDGEIVGCAYAVRRLTPASGSDLQPDLGWIPFMFVTPKAQHSGVGQQLLRSAVDFLLDAERTVVDFGCYTPNYFVPGLEAAAYPEGDLFLRRAGFEVRGEPVAMDRTLVGYAIPSEVAALRRAREADGYRFDNPTEGEIPELLAFAGNGFAPDWAEAIRDSLRQGHGLRRIQVAWRQDKIAGFAMYAAYRGIPERFGPFGVDGELRGSGLGKILLHQTLHAMRAEGLHTAWFLWTGELSAAGHLYKQAGFSVTRRFQLMRADLAAITSSLSQ
jgi:GNAT superfamily N-acetyltransferase